MLVCFHKAFVRAAVRQRRIELKRPEAPNVTHPTGMKQITPVSFGFGPRRCSRSYLSLRGKTRQGQLGLDALLQHVSMMINQSISCNLMNCTQTRLMVWVPAPTVQGGCYGVVSVPDPASRAGLPQQGKVSPPPNLAMRHGTPRLSFSSYKLKFMP
jgi:hypothetical protein